VALEAREQQVLLPPVVLLHVHEVVVALPAGSQLRGRLSGVRQRLDLLDRAAHAGDRLAQCLVLSPEGVERMARRDAWRLGRDQELPQHLGVQVAHGLHFGHGHAVCDEGLLHRRDLGGVGLPHERPQPIPHLVGGPAAMEVADHVLHRLDPVLAVVDQFAHGGPPWPRMITHAVQAGLDLDHLTIAAWPFAPLAVAPAGARERSERLLALTS